MHDIVALSDVTVADLSRVGGKGWHLGRLANEGLPVPPGLVVTTDVFTEALRTNHCLLSARDVVHNTELAPALRETIAAWPPPPSLQADVERALAGIDGPFAVRSSGVDEDGRDRSFAGQHHTQLSVKRADVSTAIIACWASLYDAEAIAYGQGQGPTPGGMAVIVQRMVEPVTSGVLFTVNPLSGSWREMTVEAVYGLAEPLVSGEVTPHWYLVRRPRRVPRPVQRILSRVRLQVLQQDLPSLSEQLVGTSEGTRTIPVPAGRQARSTLDRRALFRLCRMGLRVESLSGAPQDIEWAIDATGRLHLLQARPITRAASPRSRNILWTRRFIGERWGEPATPLGWSLMRPILEHFIAYPRTQRRYLGGGLPLKLVRSRPYINVTAFRHLAFKLPGTPPPRFMLELVPPEEEANWQRRFAGMPDVSVYLSFLRETVADRRWTRFRYNPLSNPTDWNAFRDRLNAALPHWDRAPVSLNEAIRRVEDQQTWVSEYVGVHLCSLLFANLSYQLLEGALSSAIPERASSLMRSLAVCPPGNLTLETNTALRRLASLATPAQLDRLAQGRLPRGRFRTGLEAFLHDYGHRSMASWELFSPRWAKHPERLAPMLQALSGSEAPDPQERADAQQLSYEAALAEVREQTSGATRASLEGLIRYVRTYLLLRENQRFSFDRLLASEQATLLWMGAQFAKRGCIHHADDIAYLSWDEVRGLATQDLQSDAVASWVASRRAVRERDAQTMPPVFLQGDEEVGTPVSGRRLQGLGISPGRVTGTVAIVRSPAEANRVPDGAILVAHAVDPGWTPLFGKVAGVVLELGSRLSHGAVVAREYGLPAVVNLDGITQVLSDGQQVTVDGTRGIVWVHT